MNESMLGANRGSPQDSAATLRALARTVLVALAVLWLLAGATAVAALNGLHQTYAAYAVLLPAIPFVLFAAVTGGSTRDGWLWNSTYGFPYLNLAGVFVVYLVPGILVLAWVLKRRRLDSSGG